MSGHQFKNGKSQNEQDDLENVIALLKELPRVEAPTDFNARLQARMAAAKAERREFADVTSLIQELPRVAAPANFNAQLMARLATAKAEAEEFAGITALMQELPRVSAPNDFDFKLRARLAQAKSAEQKTATNWLSELFGRGFSWAQASAAMTAVAVMVAAITFGVMRSNESSGTGVATQTANNVQSVETVVPAPRTVDESRNAEVTQREAASFSTAVPKARTIRYTAHVPTPSQPVATSIREDVPSPAPVVATKVMIKHQNGEARMVYPAEYNLGLQTAHYRPAAPKASPNSNELVATNIY